MAIKIPSTQKSFTSFTYEKDVEESYDLISNQEPSEASMQLEKREINKENRHFNREEPIIGLENPLKTGSSLIEYPEKPELRKKNFRNDNYWHEIDMSYENDFSQILKNNPAYDLLYKEKSPIIAQSKPKNSQELPISSLKPGSERYGPMNREIFALQKHPEISQSDSMSDYSGRQSFDYPESSVFSPTLPFQLKVDEFSQSSDQSRPERPSQAGRKIEELKEYKRKLEAIKKKVLQLSQLPSSHRTKKEEDFLKKAKEAIKSGDLDLVSFS